jgi:branched-chain amino acid transport system substrate-binding protein
MKMKSEKIGIGFVYVFLTVILLTGIPSGAIAADQIRIGLLEPLSGPFEAFGRGNIEGVRFAVDEQNAQGGMFGKKIELFIEDSENKPDVAVRKAKKLILENKCNFIGAGSSSSVSVALNKVAESYKVIHMIGTIAPALTGKEFTRYAFRTWGTVYSNTVGMILLSKARGYKKFYYLCWDLLSGHESTDYFDELLKIHIPDGRVVGKAFFPPGTKDFVPYTTEMMAAKPDAILIGAIGADLINAVKQSRRLGLEKTAFLSHVFADPYLMNELKEDALGLINSAAHSMRVKTAENQDMIRRFHEKHKNDKDFYLWWPFPDCAKQILTTKMFLAGLEKAGTTDPEIFIKTFEGFQWKSPLGSVWYVRPCDHQAILPQYASVIEGGWNPYYNGSIRPEVKFPWEGEDVQEFPAEAVAPPSNVPGTSAYNPRCK